MVVAKFPRSGWAGVGWGALFPLDGFGSGDIGLAGCEAQKKSSLQCRKHRCNAAPLCGRGPGLADGEKPNWRKIVHQMALSGWWGSCAAQAQGRSKGPPLLAQAVPPRSERVKLPWAGRLSLFFSFFFFFTSSLTRRSATRLAKGIEKGGGWAQRARKKRWGKGGRPAMAGEENRLGSRMSCLVQFGVLGLLL